MSGWRDSFSTDFLRTPSMEMDEKIPVDNFFEDYMSRLQSSYITEERIMTSNDRGTFPSASGVSEAFPPAATFDRKYGKTQLSHLGSLSQPAQSGYPTDESRSPLPESNFMDPTFFGNQTMTRMPPQSGYGELSGTMEFVSRTETAGGSAHIVDNSHLQDGSYMPQSGDTITTSIGSGMNTRVSKSKHKSVRQQQLNKLAQQRYRERKKAKAVGLEHTVNALTEQLTQLSAVREEKLALEEKNLNLERKLTEKEAELQAMKIKLDEAAKSGGGNNSSDLTAYPTEERPKVVGRDSKVALLFHEKVRELKRYLKNNGLDQTILINPLDDKVSKTHVDAIHKLVGDVCMICMQLSRHDGPDLWDLISANLDNKKRETHDRSVWRSIAQSLKLNNDQIMTACRLREQHLMKLETIYIQRQNLNLEAIKLLLPSDLGGRDFTPQTIGCFNLATFIQRIRHTSKVSACLDKLKENLSNEQKLNSELEYMSFYRVMSPLQGAWFTVNAYPHQCDCLAFLNAVFELYGHEAIRNQETGSN